MTALITTGGYPVSLLPLASLSRHEQYEPDHARKLSAVIGALGVLSRPVVVEARTLTLLDGHHRLAALLILGCRCVPSVLLDYDDPRIVLESWRPDLPVDRDRVIAAARSGCLLPPKTSKHSFTPDVGDVGLSLERLYAPAPA
jgi:L-serine kinase (ADP)